MPTFTLPGDVVEDLVKVYRGVVPQDLGTTDRSDNLDDVYALAEMMAIGDNVAINWSRQVTVSTASGLYLEVLARGVGLHKAGGESDPSLQQRIRTPPYAVTPDLILTAMQQLVTAVDPSGIAYMVELPRSGFYWGRKQSWARGWRWASRTRGIVIVLIPAAASAALGACLDALRAKVLAGKSYMVQLYT